MSCSDFDEHWCTDRALKDIRHIFFSAGDIHVQGVVFQTPGSASG